MNEKQHSDYFYNSFIENSNNTNTKVPDNDKDKIVVMPFQSLLCIIIGWLGLTIVASIIYEIVSLFINDIENINPLFRTQIITWINFSAYAIIFITLFIILGKHIFIKFFKGFINLDKIGKGVMYGGILLGASIIYNAILLLIYPDYGSNQNQNGVVEMISKMPIVSFITVVIFAPIVEEITYRLCLTGILYKKSKSLAIVISSLLFGLIHSSFIDFSFLDLTTKEIIIELLTLPSYIISGFIMARAYLKEDSIQCSVIAHVTNNLIAFLSVFATTEELFRLF